MLLIYEIIGIVVGPMLFIGAMMMGAVIGAVRKVGFFRMVILLMVGRHHSGRHHTNATFWRDSNGNIVGHATYHMAPRYHRAGYKNLGTTGLYLWGIGIVGWGLAMNWRATMVSVGIGIAGGIGIGGFRTCRKMRRWYRNRAVVAPLARGLAKLVEVGEADMEKAIHLEKGWEGVKDGVIGRVDLPDTYLGSDGQVTEVSSFVERRFPKGVEISWQHKAPVHFIISARRNFPEVISFWDRISDIQACRRREYVAGYNRQGEVEILSHAGDAPMKGYSMNTGTGKTTRVIATAAQLLGNDPKCRVVGFDVKRISLLALEKIPGVTIYSNPFKMEEMWNGWYALKAEMDRRYEEIREMGKYRGEDVWVFLEEGPIFSVLIKAYYANKRKGKGDPAAPPIWYEAIAPVLFQGREAGIFVSAMMQTFMERYFGNINLRPAFNTIGLAGYKPSQYRAIVGTTPVPACQGGAGKMLICEPDREVWIKGLYGEAADMVRYALERRGA